MQLYFYSLIRLIRKLEYIWEVCLISLREEYCGVDSVPWLCNYTNKLYTSPSGEAWPTLCCNYKAHKTVLNEMTLLIDTRSIM